MLKRHHSPTVGHELHLLAADGGRDLSRKRRTKDVGIKEANTMAAAGECAGKP